MDHFNEREFLQATALLGTAAAVPSTAGAGADQTPGRPTDATTDDLVDEKFSSSTGRHVASQIIHRGEPWLGPLPGHKRVTLIAACNGGGFKFSSVDGDALADLATERKTELPIGFMMSS